MIDAVSAVDTYDWSGFADGLEEIMRQFYPDLLALAAGETSRTLPFGVSFDLSNPRVLDTVNQLAGQIRGVSDTVRDQVAKIVVDATQSGATTADIAKKLQEFGVT